MLTNELLNYYQTDCNEDTRLTQNQNNLIEYQTTMHFLTKHIKPKSAVLDCCAGGGIYAFPLAKAGHTMTVGDLVDEHVEILREKNTSNQLSKIYQGDILDMSKFEDNSFDAVLCLGALYHLHEQTHRVQALNECIRVLKPDGLLFFAYINRNAMFINNFSKNPSLITKHTDILLTGKNGVFYGMDFCEVDKLTSNFNIKKITNVGIDGLRYPLYDKINSCSEEDFEVYMKYHIATCEEASILGQSMHGLWIGQKR